METETPEAQPGQVTPGQPSRQNSASREGMDSEKIVKRFFQINHEGIEGIDWVWDTSECYERDVTNGKTFMAHPEKAKKKYLIEGWKPLINDKRTLSVIASKLLFHINPQSYNANPQDPREETLNIMADFIGDLVLLIGTGEIEIPLSVASLLTNQLEWIINDSKTSAFNGPNSLSNKEVDRSTVTEVRQKQEVIQPQQPRFKLW